MPVKHCPRYECKLVRTGTEKYHVDTPVAARVNTSEAACRIVTALVQRELGDSPNEAFCVITLDTKLVPIGFIVITRGTLDASLVHPREVFRPAIAQNASAILIVHNHPSGDLTPSRQDREVSHRLEESGKILGINVIDHVIVGMSLEGTWNGISLRELGWWTA